MRSMQTADAAPTIAPERLESLVKAFPERSIGLVGDLFLDRYLDIDADLTELSIETGLEAYQVSRIRNSPGALGTVINNLVALGVGKLVPVAVVGDDGQAYDLLQRLQAMGVETSQVLRDPKRNTPTYTKPMKQDAGGVWRELNRLDIRNRSPMSAETEQEVMRRIDRVFTQCDGLIVLDQVNEEGWGVVTPGVRDHLARLAQANPDKLMFVDSRAHIDKFRGGVLKPNLSECARAVGHAEEPDLAAGAIAAQTLSNRSRLSLYCTAGAEGILVVEPGGEPAWARGIRITGPIDIVGAGDSATAAIVASLLAGASRYEAAQVGNLAASITIQQLGTTGTASPTQLLDRCREVQAGVFR
jgi:rfaE bifunctional protein kinase chain/domain